MNRRRFAAGVLSAVSSLRAGGRFAPALDDVLSKGIQRRGIPAVVAIVAGPNEILYQGAFGKRDSSGTPIALDSIFAIASMTKPITSVAAMQLVEQGKLALDEPVAKHLPQFATFQVLDGFDERGRAQRHQVRTPVTLRHLLTHTAGFAYTIWHPALARYAAQGANSEMVLVFEPGTAWQYGYSADWTGRLIEKVSGLTLEQYFHGHVTGPLGMDDTEFQIPAKKFDRMASRFTRAPKSYVQEIPRKLPGPPQSFSGGGGLYGTAPDFVRFMQMILRRGRSVAGTLLKPESVDEMTRNQIGGLSAGKLKSLRPEIARDTDFHPGFEDKFGLGFLINTTAYANGRSVGSLAWAGIDNTFFWIDPQRQICATLMMQYLPFCDKEAIGLLNDFERTVYATL